MKFRFILVSILICSGSLLSQEQSSYYQKGTTWQKSVAHSIQSFHGEWEKMQDLLSDRSVITLDTWYSVGGFPGERNELHKKEFG